MTAREWMKKNKPDHVSDNFRGGVMGCPNFYPGTPVGELILPYACSGGDDPKICTACWNRKLPEVTE